MGSDTDTKVAGDEVAGACSSFAVHKLTRHDHMCRFVALGSKRDAYASGETRQGQFYQLAYELLSAGEGEQRWLIALCNAIASSNRASDKSNMIDLVAMVLAMGE